MNRPTKRKKRIKIPHVFIILFCFVVVMTLLTHVIPSGVYDRITDVNGREIVDPTSFQYIEAEPAGLMSFITSIPRGFVDSSSIIVFVLILSGAFEVITRTQLINVGISHLAKRFSHNRTMIVPILMLVFGVLAGFIATPELSMIYVPIILPLMILLGFDSMTAVAIPLIATGAGFSAAMTNPFTVGVAQEIAGLPMFSGLWLRVIILILFLASGIIYVMRYAKRIQSNPQESLTFETDRAAFSVSEVEATDNVRITPRQVGVGVSFVALFALLVYGVLNLGWYMIEMAGIFLVMGVLAGIIGGISGDQICESFVQGASNVLAGALVIGIARAVTIVMDDAMITDTVVYSLAQAVGALPESINAVGMLIVQTLLNFLLPSGSGQALVTMPILSPLADVVGVNQQVAVLGLQFGDGLSNIIYPTVGYFMATLAIAKVEWSTWIKFFWKLMAFWVLLAGVIMVAAQAFNYGPF